MRRAENGPGQAGRPAVAEARDVVALVRDHVDPGLLHPPTRLVVALSASARRGPSASTFEPIVSNSSSGTSTISIPRSASSSISRTGAIRG